jgi:putative FmdB family regulatory protein
MPTYEYVCSACNNAWEEIQRITEPAVEICPRCSQRTARRQISAANFILKGGGWYADLYSSSKGSSEKRTEREPPPKFGESKGGPTASPSKDAAAPAPAAAPAAAASSGGGSGTGASKE